mgnify:CR=1 FL=1
MVFVTCAKDILVRRGCQLEEIAEFCRRRHHRQLVVVVVVRREFWFWFCVGSNDWLDGEGGVPELSSMSSTLRVPSGSLNSTSSTMPFFFSLQHTKRSLKRKQ